MEVDPARPRVMLTPFAFFVQTCKEEHRKRFPEEKIDFVKLSRTCESRWKIMSDGQKERFNMIAEADKKRWTAEMEIYDASQWKKEKVKIKDSNAPKKPGGSFFLFSKDIRSTVRFKELDLGERNSNMGKGNGVEIVSKMWEELEPRVREEYEARSLAEWAKYDKDMLQYKASAAYEAGEDGEESD